MRVTKRGFARYDALSAVWSQPENRRTRAGRWHGAKSFRLLTRPFMPNLPHPKCGLLPWIGTSRIRTAAQSGSEAPSNTAQSRLFGWGSRPIKPLPEFPVRRNLRPWRPQRRSKYVCGLGEVQLHYTVATTIETPDGAERSRHGRAGVVWAGRGRRKRWMSSSKPS
jgi:hypothetical protein